MSINRIRQQHLKTILEEEYSNNRGQLAEKLNIAPSTLNKYLSSGKFRPISDAKARQFEQRLEKPLRSLDHALSNTAANVYYIRVTFSGGHPHEFLRILRRYDIVKEASAQYGEADIFVKIEANEEEYQSLIFNTIRTFPGITKTTTSQALNASRWQRNQGDYYRLPKEKTNPHNILQNYIQTKRIELYEELHDLDKGRKIVVHKNDINSLSYYELLENADISVKMTIFYNKRTQARLEQEFIESKQKVSQQVKFKIILLTNETISNNTRKNLQNFSSELQADTNIEILDINKTKWIGHRKSAGAITLTIIDDSIVSILNGESYTLGYKDDIVNQYCKIFQRNWVNALDQNRFY